MQTKKKKTITVIDKTLGLHVRCIFGGSEEQAHAECPRWTGCEVDGEADATNFGWTLMHANRALIWLEQHPTNAESQGALVHELAHAVSQFCSFVGIKDEETFAYLMQHFFTQFMTKFKAK
jgi:hypothetical protein